MAEYKSYINALKQCAKEHESELVSFAHIRTTDLCNDTANLLEKLETESDNSITIPEEATNGKMFMTMFPELNTIEDNGGSIYVHYPDYGWMHFDREWWNAPYKKEEEE